MKLHWRNPLTVEFEGWPDTSSQEALNSAPAWHKRLQRLRCALGFHYWARSREGRWTWEYGHEYQFRSCSRWAPECMVTDYRPRKQYTYPVTFPLYPFYLLKWRFERWTR